MFKPNLAGTPDDKYPVLFPCLASPKIDGVRAMVHPSGVMSRSMKPIPSTYIQGLLSHARFLGLDGELTVGSPTDPNCMQNTTSGVMAIKKTPDFTFHVFDRFDLPDDGFMARFMAASTQVLVADPEGALVKMVPHAVISCAEELDSFEAAMLAEGWEGIMVRSMGGKYKQGRSTPKEGGLLKIKRFVDGEFIITGFEEQMENTNEKTINELGRSKRSTHAAGKVGKGTLGAFKAQHVFMIGGKTKLGAEFNIGTGMDDAFRAWAWANQDMLIDQYGVYKSFPVGVKDAPRHPVFKSLREKWDMS